MRRRKRQPTDTAASELHRHGNGYFGCHPALDPDSRHCSIARREDGAGGLCSCLGTRLGTSKSRKGVRVPSEATPDKRDVVFALLSHNPKVVGSNPPPATNRARTPWRFRARSISG